MVRRLGPEGLTAVRVFGDDVAEVLVKEGPESLGVLRKAGRGGWSFFTETGLAPQEEAGRRGRAGRLPGQPREVRRLRRPGHRVRRPASSPRPASSSPRPSAAAPRGVSKRSIGRDPGRLRTRLPRAPLARHGPGRNRCRALAAGRSSDCRSAGCSGRSRSSSGRSDSSFQDRMAIHRDWHASRQF